VDYKTLMNYEFFYHITMHLIVAVGYETVFVSTIGHRVTSLIGMVFHLVRWRLHCNQ